MNAQQQDHYDTFGSTQKKKGLSGGAKWGIGCAITAIVVIILVCGGIAWLFYAIWGQSVGKFTAMGYTPVFQETVTITTQLDQDTVYVTGSFSLEAEANANIAILSETADIHANVNGNVDFMGDTITIYPDAVITGDLNATCARVILQGQVLGQITGDQGEFVDERDKPADNETTPADQQDDTGGDGGEGGGEGGGG